MPSLTPLSLQRLATCHPDLQKLVLAVVDLRKIAVLCGHRGREEQDAAFHDGKSKTPWPQSRHNLLPSMAVDLAPLTWDGKVNWEDKQGFVQLAAAVKAKAVELGVKVRWGGDWLTLKDLDHFQLEIP